MEEPQRADIQGIVRYSGGMAVLSPFCVSLDWLTLGMYGPMPNPLDGPEPFDFRTKHFDGRLWCVPKTYGTQVFARVTEVLNADREKVLTIAHRPRSGDKDPTWCHVQFANSTLYTGEWVALFQMLRSIGFTTIGISRVDISADGIEGEGGDFMQVMDRRMSGELKYYGKGDWSPYMTRDKLNGFRMGTMTSDKFIRCYNKTREMKKRGMKPWIVNTWAAATGGVDLVASGIEVQRFEAQLKGKGIRRYVGTRERDPEWIAGLAQPKERTSLFASMAPSVFDFREPAERARDARPALEWDFSKVYTGDLDLTTRAPRNYAVTRDELKRGLRYVYMLALGMSRPELAADAECMAEAYSEDMAQWFRRKRQEWFKQYGKMLQGGDTDTLRFFANLANGADNSAEASARTFGLE